MTTSEMQLNLSAESLDPEARHGLHAAASALWRARLLPVLGVAGLLFAWWAVVAGFHVKPFIAPSPLLVLQTLFSKSDVLLQNLVPTAIEAVRRFPDRQPRGDPACHRLRAQQDAAGHLLSGRGDDQLDSGRREGADSRADHG